jgi:hypothetical protein
MNVVKANNMPPHKVSINTVNQDQLVNNAIFVVSKTP